MKGSYDEMSPITGTLCVLVEEDPETKIVSKICMESGFTTTGYLTEEYENEILKWENSLPEIARKVRIKDDFGFFWYPVMLATSEASIIPVPDSEEVFNWEVCRIIQLSEEEKQDYPRLDTEGYYDSIIDHKSVRRYGHGSFEQAYDYFTSLLKSEE